MDTPANTPAISPSPPDKAEGHPLHADATVDAATTNLDRMSLYPAATPGVSRPFTGAPGEEMIIEVSDSEPGDDDVPELVDDSPDTGPAMPMDVHPTNEVPHYPMVPNYHGPVAPVYGNGGLRFDPNTAVPLWRHFVPDAPPVINGAAANRRRGRRGRGHSIPIDVVCELFLELQQMGFIANGYSPGYSAWGPRPFNSH